MEERRETEGLGRSIPQRSGDTHRLYTALIQLKKGEAIGYDALGALIGRSVRFGSSGSSNLQSAKELALTQGIVIGTIEGVGVKHETDEEIVDDVTRSIDMISRKARKGLKKLSKISDFIGMSQEKREQALATSTTLELNDHIGRAKQQRTIAAAVRASKGALPPHSGLRELLEERR